jgi:transcription antitermination factor NusA-like protein
MARAGVVQVMRRYTLLCDDVQARAIRGLAAEYSLTEQEVIRQLLAVGLDHIEVQRHGLRECLTE